MVARPPSPRRCFLVVLLAGAVLVACRASPAGSTGGTGTGGTAATASGSTGSGGSAADDTTGTFDAGGPDLPPATLFVRPDGDDACDGRADAPGPAGGGSCALATIAEAAVRAGCGDVVAIRAGAYGEPRISVDLDCPPEAPVEFRGDGPEGTRWMAALVAVDPATCGPDGTGALRCALPEGALDPGADPSPSWAPVQADPGVVRFEDENGVSGDMTGPLALTWNTGAVPLAEGQVRILTIEALRLGFGSALGLHGLALWPKDKKVKGEKNQH